MFKKHWDKKNKYTEGLLKEYSYWLLEVSYRQHTLGCFIVFATRPIEKLTQLTDEELLELRIVLTEIETALTSLPDFKPDRFNYEQLGNDLHQLHIHGIPRYSSPRTFGGREWNDETFGHPPVWTFDEASVDLVMQLRDKIKPALP